MDFTVMIPRQYHAGLKWLGKLGDDVWDIFDEGELRTVYQLKKDVVHAAPGFSEHAELITKLSTRRTHLWNPSIEGLAAALAKGPKLFVPTAEQFDSMQQVDVNIPIKDYRQPYPSFIIKIPQQSKRALGIEFGVDPALLPSYILMRHRLTSERKDIIWISQDHDKDEGISTGYFFQDRPAFTTIEDALDSHILDTTRPVAIETRDHAITQLTARAAINLSLMMTHYGCKLGEPVNPKQYAKHRSKPEFERFAMGDFRTIDMKQNIIVRESRGCLHDEEPIPSGREMKPHWRRGHWRNQHWGPGNQYTKLVFINPVLIRPDRIVGDVAESQALYRS